MGSALLDTTPATAAGTHAAAMDAAARSTHASLSGEALRHQAAERLAAHRNKRAGARPARDAAEQASTSSNTRAAQIAAAVAERYAKSQSYKAFLAAEAERAVQQARAAAEVAAIKAEAMEAAQQSLLASLDAASLHTPTLDPDIPAEPSGIAPHSICAPKPVIAEELSFWPEAELPRPARDATPKHAPKPPTHRAPAPAAVEPTPEPARFAVKLTTDVHLPHVEPDDLRENRFAYRDDAPEEALALDEEIAFRHAPVFEEFRRPEPLPANLIEFPRQLVAPRKARPRLAEGPLRDEVAAADDGQLRIFEVETSQISHAPAIEEAAFPQWTNILLDAPEPAPAVAQPEPAAPAAAATGLPGIASVARRSASAAINGSIIAVALAAFAAAACITSGNVDTLRSFSMSTLLEAIRTPDGRSILAAGALVAILLTFVYQALFFAFSTATPGMRCTRIALCTFDDNNPSRKAMRRRILAILLSAVPFGLGFIWAALDEEKLSWHDRVSGMYQREY